MKGLRGDSGKDSDIFKIAIDVGNSETTVGVGNNLSWRSYRYTTRKTITSDELFMMFKTVPLWHERLLHITAIIH